MSDKVHLLEGGSLRGSPMGAVTTIGTEVRLMRYLKYLALLAVLVMLPAIHSQAQVAIGVQIGPTYGFYNTPPPCPYGY